RVRTRRSPQPESVRRMTRVSDSRRAPANAQHVSNDGAPIEILLVDSTVDHSAPAQPPNGRRSDRADPDAAATVERSAQVQKCLDRQRVETDGCPIGTRIRCERSPDEHCHGRRSSEKTACEATRHTTAIGGPALFLKGGRQHGLQAIPPVRGRSFQGRSANVQTRLAAKMDSVTGGIATRYATTRPPPAVWTNRNTSKLVEIAPNS